MKCSNIGYTDYSAGDLNFVSGCTAISVGCANCYARAIYERMGRDFSQVQTHPEKLARLAKARFPAPDSVGARWNKRGNHSRPLAFVCDTGDLFHDDVPSGFIYEALMVMASRTDVDWLVLTKRAERMANLASWWFPGGETAGVRGATWPANVWPGVTVENQEAVGRIRFLSQVPAAVRWLSVEPCLAKIEMREYLGFCLDCDAYIDEHREDGPFYHDDEPRIHWVVCGAESGPNRRPFDPAWALSLYRQCQEAGIPFFFKQGSALRPGQDALLPGVGEVKEWPR